MIETLLNKFLLEEPVYRVAAPLDQVKQEYHLNEIYKLNSNENPFGVSPKAVAAMQKAAAEVNFYPEGTGAALRAKIGERLGIAPDQVMITEGASVALNLIGEAFILPDDEVVEPAVTYGSYRGIIKRNGGVVVDVPMREDLGIDFPALLRAITPKTKLIFLCNPNNPTSIACDPQELLDFLDAVPAHVVTIVDEAYIQFVDDPDYPSMVGQIADNKNLLVVQTLSKLYGMAGARVGYILSNAKIIKYLNRIANYFCTNKLALAGAVAALDDTEFAAMTLRKTKEGRDYLTRALREMGFAPYPSSTNFLYVDCKVDPFALCEELKKQGYAIRGNFALTRISIGTMAQNEGLIAAMKRVLPILPPRE